MKGNGLDTTSVRRWRRYPAYRACQADWLREAPEHWRVERLKWTVAACQNGAWGTEPDGGPDDIACVRVADFDRTRFVVPEGVDFTIRAVPAAQRKGKMLRRGDLLLEKSGGGELQPVGVVMLFDSDTPAVCSNFIARMPQSAGQEPSFHRYLHAALYSGRLNTRSINQSTGIQNLDASAYLNEFAPFPPLAEQRAIAAFLDRETARIDALVEQKERLIALLEEKRQAIISHAVTRGLDISARLKDSGVPWMGKIPTGWKVKRLKMLIRPGTSISYGIVQPGDNLPDGVPFVQTTNMTSGDFDLRALSRTAKEIAAAYPRSTLAPGDLLLGIRASIGAAHVVPSHLAGVNLSRGVARIVLGEEMSAEFACQYLRSRCAGEYWELAKQGSTFNEVSIETVRELPVLVPPLDEQRHIVHKLRSNSSQLDRICSLVNEQVGMLREYRTALISAAVTGQIDVRPEAAP